MSYTFVVDNNEIEEARSNTTEPFKNLFITKVDSDEIGYEVQGDVIVIKYEMVDDERFVIRSNQTYEENGYITPLPSLFGVAAKLHGCKTMVIGSSKFAIDVAVNSEESEYVAARAKVGYVEYHQSNGVVFELVGNRYVAVSNNMIKAIRDSYAAKGLHGMIPEKYMVRFQVGDRFVYSHLANAYRDPLVAHSFNREIPEELWADLKMTLSGLE